MINMKTIMTLIGVSLILFGIFGRGFIMNQVAQPQFDEFDEPIKIDLVEAKHTAAIVSGIIVGIGVSITVFALSKNPIFTIVSGISTGLLVAWSYWSVGLF